MSEINDNSINLINELEKSILQVSSIYGEMECGSGTTGHFVILLIGHNTDIKQNLIWKNENVVDLLTNMSKKLSLEPTWRFKLRNAFDFVKEIFFYVTGVNMWISAFKEIKKKWKEPA